MNRSRHFGTWIILTVAVIGIAVKLDGATADGVLPSTLPARVDFNRDIRPVLSTKCFACHGQDPGGRMAGLRLDRREEAVKDRGGYRALNPGKPADSRVYQRIAE